MSTELQLQELKKEINVFEELSKVNVNRYTEKKQGLTYLSWANAWTEFKKVVPQATYEIVKVDGRPYYFDEHTGYMVYTRVTVDDQTHEMCLPVMNSSNKAMKNRAYTYKVKNYKTSQYEEKTVGTATMFDINKTIMRCLTKNLAMFGLGLYIYAGEDLPQSHGETPEGVEDNPQSTEGVETVELFDGKLPEAVDNKESCIACKVTVPNNVANFSEKKYGKVICYKCQQKIKK